MQPMKPSAGPVKDRSGGGTPLPATSIDDRARRRRRSIGYVFEELSPLPGLAAVLPAAPAP